MLSFRDTQRRIEGWEEQETGGGIEGAQGVSREQSREGCVEEEASDQRTSLAVGVAQRLAWRISLVLTALTINVVLGRSKHAGLLPRCQWGSRGCLGAPRDRCHTPSFPSEWLHWSPPSHGGETDHLLGKRGGASAERNVEGEEGLSPGWGQGKCWAPPTLVRHLLCVPCPVTRTWVFSWATAPAEVRKP